MCVRRGEIRDGEEKARERRKEWIEGKPGRKQGKNSYGSYLIYTLKNYRLFIGHIIILGKSTTYEKVYIKIVQPNKYSTPGVENIALQK
jgi:hypothetical protein